MKSIQDFKIGERASFKHRITEDDVRKFVDLTGDDNPLHVDPKFAEKTPFKGIVTHGMLSASFISTMIGKYIPGEGALWVSQHLDFLLPVRLNDELEISAEVTHIHLRQNLLHLSVQIANQHGQKVLRGDCQVKVLSSSNIESPTKDDVLQKEKEAKIRNVSDQIAIVTGASRGIGAAIAKRLAMNGYKVVINYHSDHEGAERTLEEIQKSGGTAILAKADISKMDEVQKMFEATTKKWGTISALVNNASPRIVEKKIQETRWEDIQSQMDVQLKGSFHCIKAALPFFEENQSGAIVNIGSQVADAHPPATWLAYNLAKSSVHSLTRSLAESLGPKGIRINTVSPGMVDTSLIAHVPEKTKLLTEAQTPLRKLATPEDIADAVEFLLSPKASHITGETLRVNGGKAML